LANQHLACRIPGIKLYARVIFAVSAVVGELVFSNAHLSPICVTLALRTRLVGLFSSGAWQQ